MLGYSVGGVNVKKHAYIVKIKNKKYYTAHGCFFLSLGKRKVGKEISVFKNEKYGNEVFKCFDFRIEVVALLVIFIWRFYNLLRLTIKSSRFQFEEEIHAKTNFSLQNSIWKDKVFNNDEGSQIKTDCPHLISIENTGAVW